jgi:hypothetical protein
MPLHADIASQYLFSSSSSSIYSVYSKNPKTEARDLIFGFIQLICYNTSMGIKVSKPPIFVKKSDSKKGKLWNNLANDRIIKQHGGYDIPEGDLHAVKRFESPVQFEEQTPEETNETLSDLTQEIEGLKQKEYKLPPPQHQTNHRDEDNDFTDDEDI